MTPPPTIDLSFLPELEKALKRASPAPWHFDGREIIDDSHNPKCIAITTRPLDAEIIRLLRNHATTLISLACVYEAQRQRAEEWRKDAERLFDNFECPYGNCMEDGCPFCDIAKAHSTLVAKEKP